MSILQSALHVALVTRTLTFDLSGRIQRYGFMVEENPVPFLKFVILTIAQAAVALAVLLVMMLLGVRHWSYELFLKSHFLLGVFVAIAAWLHLRNKFGFGGICLLAAVGSFLLSSTIHIIFQLFRNVTADKRLAIANLKKVKDAVELTFRPPRPWKVHAGQYIYIRAPAARTFSFAESHPFSIAWWEAGPDGRATSISVLAKVESGFTRTLEQCEQKRLRVLLDGPYGQQKDTETYDSIVLVATGIGIASQLSYAKGIIERQVSTQGQVKDQFTGPQKKRISLIWELEEEYHEDWISDWMDTLLNEDSKTLALNYSLYILNKLDPAHREGQNIHIGRRGAAFYGKPDLSEILKKEIQICPGRLLLTVAADPETRDKVRGIVLRSNGRVDFHESDHQPGQRKDSFWAPKKSHHVGVA
ncbi:hypothetical protein BBP40_007916 [Aspergillus hancockii]|nr:hypothetical protein BBP40_007916 [Aspergillus hancockii]